MSISMVEREITIIIMSTQIRLVNDEIVIGIKLPEFTIDHIEMFIWEILCNHIDVITCLEIFDDPYKITLRQFSESNPIIPIAIEIKEDSHNNSIDIMYMEVYGCL